MYVAIVLYRCCKSRSADVAIVSEAVASICFECFRCFRGILHVFQMDVAKVNRDVAYVAMVVHVCCKGLSLMFHLCFLDTCCKCVYLDVAYVSHIRCNCCAGCNGFQFFFKCFRSVFPSVSSAFRRMLQLLYLDVSEADRVLHLSSPPSAASSRCVLLPMPIGHPYGVAARSF
jgi:hypothetical protein